MNKTMENVNAQTCPCFIKHLPWMIKSQNQRRAKLCIEYYITKKTDCQQMTYFFAIRMPKQNTLQKNHKYSDRIFLFDNTGFCIFSTNFTFELKNTAWQAWQAIYIYGIITRLMTMKMGVCAPLGGQKRFLCEIRGFNSNFGDFFSNIGQSLYEQKHCSVRSRKTSVF